jgi:hypothetical protein
VVEFPSWNKPGLVNRDIKGLVDINWVTLWIPRVIANVATSPEYSGIGTAKRLIN